MNLVVSTERSLDVLIVRLNGELDHHASDYVRQTIEQELDTGVLNLVLNLSQLEFMDSSGLGVILGRYKRIMELGGRMALCSIHPTVARLMELSGLFKILPIYNDEQSAITACEVAS